MPGAHLGRARQMSLQAEAAHTFRGGRVEARPLAVGPAAAPPEGIEASRIVQVTLVRRPQIGRTAPLQAAVATTKTAVFDVLPGSVKVISSSTK